MSLAVGREARTSSGFDELPGVTPPSSREPRPGFLSDMIVEMGLADSEHGRHRDQGQSRVLRQSRREILVAAGAASKTRIWLGPEPSAPGSTTSTLTMFERDDAQPTR